MFFFSKIHHKSLIIINIINNKLLSGCNMFFYKKFLKNNTKTSIRWLLANICKLKSSFTVGQHVE